MNNVKKLHGNIIPVPGMYSGNLSINKSAYKKFIESKVSDGDEIFYLAYSASEFKYMSAAERLQVVEVVSNVCNNNNATLLAQPAGSGSLHSHIEEAKSMMDYGVDALVLLPTKPVMAGKFYSCHYEKSGFSEEVHGQYYIDYIESFSNKLDVSLVFHDAPLNNNKGIPAKILHKIMTIKNVHGVKVHSSDPCSMQKIYAKYSSSKLCFDGFGKTAQLWSLIWGANTRHTCWSWFDSMSDQKFFTSAKSGDLSVATGIVNREWELANVIKSTGFGGYKELMRINGLVDNNLTREPGLHISKDEAKLLNETYKKYKEVIANSE